MENKEELKEIEEDDEDDEEKEDFKKMKLSRWWSRNPLRFCHCLRITNSILIVTNSIWYSHYYLFRTDDDKYHSYFTSQKSKSKSKSNSKNRAYVSSEREFLTLLTGGSIIFCVLSNLLLKIYKYSLTKLLKNIKYSHRNRSQPNIILPESDLALLTSWKVLLGGSYYYFGGSQLSCLIMIYIALGSETTMFSSFKMDQIYIAQNNNNNNNWKDRYFQFSNESQEISIPEHISSQTNIDNTSNDDVYTTPHSTESKITVYILRQCGIWAALNVLISYNAFPTASLCLYQMFKCSSSMEHRFECMTWLWINKWICRIAIAKGILLCIINKLHYSHYFTVRDLLISNAKQKLIGRNQIKKNKRKNIANASVDVDSSENDVDPDLDAANKNKNKNKRSKLSSVLSLRTLSYDIVGLLPWFCFYFSAYCSNSSSYYSKTFASTQWYRYLSTKKHEKNKYLLKILSISSLLCGLWIHLGNDSYFKSVKYAKKWYFKYDKYSVKQYQNQKKIKQILKNDEKQDKILLKSIIESSITPGGDDVGDVGVVKNIANQQVTRGVSSSSSDSDDQRPEGSNIKSFPTKKYTPLQKRLKNNDYQQEYEMLLTAKYFNQKAHDIFEWMTEFCVKLEDRFLNMLIVKQNE